MFLGSIGATLSAEELQPWILLLLLGSLWPLLSIFSLVLPSSLGTFPVSHIPSITITIIVFCFLSTTSMSDCCHWLAGTCLPLWIWKFHRIEAFLFSSTFCGISHLDIGGSSPYSGQKFMCNNASYLVVPFSVYCSCLHLIPCHDVLDCLWGLCTVCTSAAQVLSSMVDLLLLWICCLVPVLLCCYDQCFSTVF